MPKVRRYTPEQIITKMRRAEMLQSQGMSVDAAARTLEIAPQTYYRRRKEYGDMNTTQARKLKDLEKKNPQLKRLSWFNLLKFSKLVKHYDWNILWGQITCRLNKALC
ncbi:MAG TPA: transposase [Anaerolineales bacterium]|nr:transposase [Anaerolineales bacterium]